MSEGREMEKKIVSRSTTGSTGKSLDKRDNGRGNGNGSNRFQRKKEPVQWSKNGNDPSPQRRVVSQKTKAYDKRPRSRKDWTGRRDEVTQAHRAEFGSALPHGPKKMNLNHLINFTIAPRDDVRGGHHGVWRGRSKWGARYHRYNKEQFLQANCQFVVKATGDYTVQSVDPDKLVDWELIEQVRLFSHEVPSCPICLYPPAAAKITRCGHIYCWPCILHYLALGEKTWRKCPICYESVHPSDLKSVKAMETHMYAAGDTITMRLMKREKGSVIVQPYTPVSDESQANQMYTLHDDNTKTLFAKLLVASNEEVEQTVIEPEKAALLKELAENKGDDLACSFITEAIKQLQARETEVTGIMKATAEATALLQDLEMSEASAEASATEDDVLIQNPTSKPSVVYASAFSEEEADSDEEDSAPKSPAFVIEEPEEALKPKSPTPKEMEEGNSQSSTPEMKEDKVKDAKMTTGSPDKHKAYYFYQAEDGQHLYMHSVNIRCLMMEYGSLDNCPPTIQAKIVAMEHMSIDQNLRRRLNFLQHLPVTCEFATCELDLKSPLLSKQTLQNFAGEILKRKKGRDRKVRDEKRRERKIQAEENKKLGKQPAPSYIIESATHFPSYDASQAISSQDIAATPESPVSSSVGSPVGSSFDEEILYGPVNSAPHSAAITIQQGDVASPPSSNAAGSWKSTGSNDADHNAAFPSFAQMLRAGKANPHAWPKVARPDSTQPTSSRKVGGASGPGGSDDSENEDYVPVPQYREAFGDAIQAALDKATVQPEPQNPSPTNKKGKKGRKKQQLLFSTAGPRFK